MARADCKQAVLQKKVASSHVSMWVLWIVCPSPVVAWTRHVCEELGAVKHLSQCTLQDLIDHSLLHVDQHRLWIQICEDST